MLAPDKSISALDLTPVANQSILKINKEWTKEEMADFYLKQANAGLDDSWKEE